MIHHNLKTFITAAFVACCATVATGAEKTTAAGLPESPHAQIQHILGLSDRQEQLEALSAMDALELQRFNKALEASMDKLVASALLESSLVMERGAAQTETALLMTSLFGAPDGDARIQCGPLMACQHTCNNGHAGCGVNASGQLTQCRKAADQDCREGVWGAKCRLEEQINLIFCVEQYANNTQKCSNAWTKCQACCTTALAGHSEGYGPVPDFSHCDDFFKEDNVGLDKEMP